MTYRSRPLSAPAGKMWLITLFVLYPSARFFDTMLSAAVGNHSGYRTASYCCRCLNSHYIVAGWYTTHLHIVAITDTITDCPMVPTGTISLPTTLYCIYVVNRWTSYYVPPYWIVIGARRPHCCVYIEPRLILTMVTLLLASTFTSKEKLYIRSNNDNKQ